MNYSFYTNDLFRSVRFIPAQTSFRQHDKHNVEFYIMSFAPKPMKFQSIHVSLEYFGEQHSSQSRVELSNQNPVKVRLFSAFHVDLICPTFFLFFFCRKTTQQKVILPTRSNLPAVEKNHKVFRKFWQKSNLHYARGIVPKCVASGGIHLRRLEPGHKWTVQLRRNIAVVASSWRHCV